MNASQDMKSIRGKSDAFEMEEYVSSGGDPVDGAAIGLEKS